MSSSSDHQSISGGKSPDATCPNCGDDRLGAYCARCGQNDRDYMRSVWLVVGDFMRDTFEIDSRIFRTLKLFFFKPGQLAIEFSRNRRARYMSPVRLFLFISFVHFGLLALVTPGGLASGVGESPGSNPATSFPMSAAGADSLFGREPTDEQIEAAKRRLEPEQQARLDDILGRGRDDPGRMIVAGLIASETGETSEARSLVYRLMIGLYHSPEDLFDRTSSRASIILVLSFPLYALMLWLVYLDKRRFFVEHLVLVVQMQSFSLVLLSIPLVAAGSTFAIGSWLLVGPGIVAYYLVTLRRYFEESWGRTVVRWLAFGALSSVVSLCVGVAVFLLTL